jgi:hypothetical protein
MKRKVFTTEIAKVTEAKPTNYSVFSVSSTKYVHPTIPGKLCRVEDIQTRPDFPKRREAKSTPSMATQSQANQSPACV